jgi:hypothetical protein
MPLCAQDLVAHDGKTFRVREDFQVFQNFVVEDYRHGRCHLMALVMAEVTEMPVGIFLDQYALESEMGDPMPALEHAFCYAPGKENFLLDAQGLNHPADLSDEYLGMANEPAELPGEEAKSILTEWMRAGKLIDFLAGEREALQEFVSDMKLLKVFGSFEFDRVVDMSERETHTRTDSPENVPF